MEFLVNQTLTAFFSKLYFSNPRARYLKKLFVGPPEILHISFQWYYFLCEPKDFQKFVEKIILSKLK